MAERPGGAGVMRHGVVSGTAEGFVVGAACVLRVEVCDRFPEASWPLRWHQERTRHELVKWFHVVHRAERSAADGDSLSALEGDLRARGLGPVIEKARQRRAEAITLSVGRSTLRSLRLAAGLSQAQLGEKVGVAQPRIAMWESEREQPHGRYMELLAVALGVDFNALIPAVYGQRNQ